MLHISEIYAPKGVIYVTIFAVLHEIDMCVCVCLIRMSNGAYKGEFVIFIQMNIRIMIFSSPKMCLSYVSLDILEKFIFSINLYLSVILFPFEKIF